MKKSKYILIAVLALGLASCSDNFLTRYPEGGILNQEQYEALGPERLDGTLRGLYSMIYTMNTSSHDEFGQRSIDLWGDILSSDVAVTNKTYGWLYTDEQMQTYNSRNYTIWTFYYDMIHNVNTTIATINKSCDVRNIVAQYGWPSAGNPGHSWTEDEARYALYLAQALTLRAYCYANLARWYTPVAPAELFQGFTIRTFPCIPIYTEENMEEAQALSSSEAVYNRVFQDIETAITMFEEFQLVYMAQTGEVFQRDMTKKLAVDVDVADGLAAYAYLNVIPYYKGLDATLYTKYATAARDHAQAVMDRGQYQLLDSVRMFTSGFNNVSEPSWMWGQDVTVETAGGLKSWFGQVDIHSYSYAWAGDTKVIDENLKNSIPEWDLRKKWFNDGSISSKFKDCPDGKFYSAACPTSTKAEDIDREWLSDNVFMRYESMFLIAAEAEYYLNNYGAAAAYLTQITDLRINKYYPLWNTEYPAFVASLSNPDDLREAIIYNWRIEMWGEGYGLQTFRRFWEEPDRYRGGNHDYNGGGKVHPSDYRFNMQIPSSEATYNPEIK